MKTRGWKGEKRIPGFLLSAVLLLSVSAEAKLLEPMVKFHTLQETVAQLLPQSEHLSRRDIRLEKRHLVELGRYKNWDTQETEFVLYHSKNAQKKITGTLILFPEHTRQGRVVVAVALDNQGRVAQALVMEAQQPTVQWLLPLMRAGYMNNFTGKDKSLKLRLGKKYRGDEFSTISRTYALRLANAVKKSAQLFDIFFRRTARRTER